MQDSEQCPGRRERKKRATRLALKAAALDLVSARGYNNVTVEDIADAVDVSVRTFFNYFNSKEAAVVGDDDELVDALRAQLIGLPSEMSPVEALRVLLMRRVQAIGEDIDLSGEDHSVWLRRFTVVRSQPEVMWAYTRHLAEVERVIVDALVQRLGGDERLRGYASLVTTCALNVMKVAGSLWAAQGGVRPLPEVAGAAFDLLADGFKVDLTAGAAGTGPAALDVLGGSVIERAANEPGGTKDDAGARGAITQGATGRGRAGRPHQEPEEVIGTAPADGAPELRAEVRAV